MTQPRSKRLAVQQYVDDAVAGEATRAGTAEGTKVNTSTYTSGQATQDAALAGEITRATTAESAVQAAAATDATNKVATETSRATAAELALRNLSDSTFVTGLSNAYARLVGVQATVSANGALVAGSHNPVDATSGNRTVTLADAPSAGLLVAVSKKDATANTVTVSVAHLRDGGAGTITLVGQYGALLLTSKADGTWWPVGDHKTKAYLDATYTGVTVDGAHTSTFAVDTTPISKSDVGLGNVDNTSDASKKLASIITIAANTTLDLTHQGAFLKFTSSSAVVCNVPGNAAVAFPIGTQVEVHQYGAGQVTIGIVGGSGVVLRSAGSALKTAAQYATIGLLKIATDEWIVTGYVTT